jgi:hypothetical protein
LEIVLIDMERPLSVPQKVGIAVAMVLAIPVVLIFLLVLWLILIDLGFDVAPR